MSVILLLLSEVKYHWSKSGKGNQTVNQFCLMRSDYSPSSRQVTVGSTVNMEREVQLDACVSTVLAKFQSVSGLNFELKKEQETQARSDSCKKHNVSTQT